MNLFIKERFYVLLSKFIRSDRDTSNNQLANNIGPNVIEWPQRTRIASELTKGLILGPSTVVADYGCGRQMLKFLLPTSWIYIPYDCYPQSEDTIVCDFNSTMPERNYDLIFCLGLLEYLDSPLLLLNHIASTSKYFIFSYNGPTTPQRRKLQGWRNELHFEEIEERLIKSGAFNLEVRFMEKNERVYLCKGTLSLE